MYKYIILDDTTFRTLSLKNDEYEVKCDLVSFLRYLKIYIVLCYQLRLTVSQKVTLEPINEQRWLESGVFAYRHNFVNMPYNKIETVTHSSTKLPRR